MDEKELIRAGIPSLYWNLAPSWPGSTTEFNEFTKLTSSATSIYEDCTNIVIGGGSRSNRMATVSALAQKFGKGRNKYPRSVVGYKHHKESLDPDTNEVLSWPFTIKMMDVKGLEVTYKEFDRDDDLPPFKDEVQLYDFFFLIEVGSEYANRFYAQVITEALNARSDAGVPTIMTVASRLSQYKDSKDNNPYEELADTIMEWKQVDLS